MMINDFKDAIETNYTKDKTENNMSDWVASQSPMAVFSLVFVSNPWFCDQFPSALGHFALLISIHYSKGVTETKYPTTLKKYNINVIIFVNT